MAGMDNELTGEQVVVDRLYGRLDDLRAQTRARLAEVRARLFDRLSPEQVTQLREICETILEGLDTSDCPTTTPGSSTVH